MHALVNTHTMPGVPGGGISFASMRAWLVPAALLAAVIPTLAVAQVGDDLTVQPVVPQGFDRDRNISVTGRSRPSYTPIGIRAGGVLVFPRLRTGFGGTTNAYLTNSNAVAAPFTVVEPAIRAVSNWSRHSLEVSGSASFRDYIGQERRNERTWNLGTSGDLDLGRFFNVAFDADASQYFENQFSGEVTSDVAALSRVRRDYVMIRGQYQAGRARAFVVADVADFRFRPLPLTNGNTRDQSERNREVKRLIGQVEYARTPTVSLFAQVGYTSTDFDGRVLSGTTRRDSSALRFLAGTNVDIAGRARGTVGVGYSIRDYQSATVATVRGISAEAELELFPTELFTITGTARRSIEDSTFANQAPFFDTRFSLRGDYEALNNLIVSARADYNTQSYIGSDLTGSGYGVGTSARYLASRRVTFDASLGYNHRQNAGTANSRNTNEARFEAGISFHI